VSRAIRDTRLESRTLCALGVLAAEHEEDELARQHLERARDLCRGREATIVCALGMAHHAAGRLQDAEAVLAAATADAEVRGDRYGEGLCRGFLGLVEMELGRTEPAMDDLTRAAARFDEIRYERYSGFFLAHAATLEASTGRSEQACALLDKARKKIDSDGDPLLCAIDWQRATIEFVSDESRPTEAKWRRVRADLAARRTCHRIVELRLSERIADWKVGASSRALPFVGIRVDIEGRWFQVDDAAPVDCSERAVQKRLLAKLATARVGTPGAVISAEALIAAAWPGEKMQHSAGKNRLKVQVAKLRALGLGDAIRSESGGYFIDPHRPIEIHD
jgi:tetratricopeptide (TPR) repeat protein